MKAISVFVKKASSILSSMFLALCFGGSTKINAQGYQAGFYFRTMSTSGEFSDNVTDNGWGYGGLFLKRIGPSPFLVGADAGFIVYGAENRQVPISTTRPPILIKVQTGSNINFVHFLTRVQSRRGGVSPYADGLIGFNHLSTDTISTFDSSDEIIAGSAKTYVSDTSLSYGVGGGLQIPLAVSGENGLMLDGNVRYLKGGRARYFKKGSIREVDGVEIFDVLVSRTDVIVFQIGITFRF